MCSSQGNETAFRRGSASAKHVPARRSVQSRHINTDYSGYATRGIRGQTSARAATIADGRHGTCSTLWRMHSRRLFTTRTTTPLGRAKKGGVVRWCRGLAGGAAVGCCRRLTY